MLVMRTSGLVLFSCAGLLLSGGAILCGSTTWSLLRMSYYFWTTDLGVELGSTVLFVAGGLLCLPACWLATLVPYHPRSISVTATLMFVVTAAMLLLSTGMSSLTGLSRALRQPEVLNASMLRAMAHDKLDPAVRSSFAAMQLEMRCCGVQSHTDWFKHRRTLPPACCNRVSNKKHLEQCDSPMFPGGCLRAALAELRYFVNSVTVLASSIVLIMAVTLFATAYTLVAGAIERGETRATFKPQPLRIACLSGHAHAHAPPLVSFTSSAGVPQLATPM